MQTGDVEMSQVASLDVSQNGDNENNSITDHDDHANETQPIDEDDKSPCDKMTTTKGVLTHLIEGYLIKESSEPFPLKPIVNNVNDGYQLKQSNGDQQQSQPNQIECVECGKRDAKDKSTKTDPEFCSIQCQKLNSKTKALNNSKSKSSLVVSIGCAHTHVLNLLFSLFSSFEKQYEKSKRLEKHNNNNKQQQQWRKCRTESGSVQK